MATLIFVHGAWHGPESWQKVTAALEPKGYKCIAKQWAFAGPEATPGVGIKPSIEQISAVIQDETSQGKDVVLINHSFAGAVGPSAVPGYTKKDPSKLQPGSGHVIGIVQVCSFIAPPNTALMDIMGDRAPLFHYAADDGFERLKPDRDVVDIFYGHCSDEEKAALPSMLKPLATAVFEGPSGRKGIYPGWMDVPTFYLRCTEDHAIPVQAQDAMIGQAKDAGATFTVRTLETDHSPFYSRPKETAEFIEEAVRAFTS